MAHGTQYWVTTSLTRLTQMSAVDKEVKSHQAYLITISNDLKVDASEIDKHFPYGWGNEFEFNIPHFCKKY